MTSTLSGSVVVRFTSGSEHEATPSARRQTPIVRGPVMPKNQRWFHRRQPRKPGKLRRGRKPKRSPSLCVEKRNGGNGMKTNAVARRLIPLPPFLATHHSPLFTPARLRVTIPEGDASGTRAWCAHASSIAARFGRCCRRYRVAARRLPGRRAHSSRRQSSSCLRPCGRTLRTLSRASIRGANRFGLEHRKRCLNNHSHGHTSADGRRQKRTVSPGARCRLESPV